MELGTAGFPHASSKLRARYRAGCVACLLGLFSVYELLSTEGVERRALLENAGENGTGSPPAATADTEEGTCDVYAGEVWKGQPDMALLQQYNRLTGEDLAT